MEINPFSTIVELKKAIESGKISTQEIAKMYSDRYARYDSAIGSALEVFDTESIIKASSNKGMLAGIPGLIKDNICQTGRIASCSSKILQNYRAPYDATVIARLKEQGSLLMGRANCDEFAMGSSTETSAYQLTRNPWNTERVPGGSSGGSAAAVAAGLAAYSLGSETGGSVRQPAAFCNLVGLKPTYGLISRYGLIAYASSLDQIGTFTRTAEDAAILLSTLAGRDERDATSCTQAPYHDYTRGLSEGIRPGMRVGVIENTMDVEGMDPEVVASIEIAIKELEKLGARVSRITLPTLDYSAAVYFILSRAEAASNLARFDGVRYGFRSKDSDSLLDLYLHTREQGFGEEVKARIMVGNFVLSVGHADEFYENARKAQQVMKQEFDETFKNFDLLISPVAPTEAFKFNAFADNKLQMDLQDYFTCAMNIVGIPALSIPCGFTKSSMPIGFQLIGPAFSEQLLLNVAHAYQQVTDWHRKYPAGYDK
jgi:aspartyl-tRNA(Asn)/glutamyl-tRNA(Gln) amidotransferase subunit A